MQLTVIEGSGVVFPDTWVIQPSTYILMDRIFIIIQQTFELMLGFLYQTTRIVAVLLIIFQILFM